MKQIYLVLQNTFWVLFLINLAIISIELEIQDNFLCSLIGISLCLGLIYLIVYLYTHFFQGIKYFLFFCIFSLIFIFFSNTIFCLYNYFKSFFSFIFFLALIIIIQILFCTIKHTICEKILFIIAYIGLLIGVEIYLMYNLSIIKYANFSFGFQILVSTIILYLNLVGIRIFIFILKFFIDLLSIK